MALVSPPKPWQKSQPDTAPHLSSNSQIASQDGSQPQAQQTAAALSQPAPGPSPTLSQPSSFAYNQSSYGYAPPSNSYMMPSYGGSGYGGGLYNGVQGGYGSSYGSTYGSSFGSAYSPMYNQWGMRPCNSMPFGNQLDAYKGGPTNYLINSGQAVMSGIQQHVSSFGRFSQLLHMNLDALQMSFSSVVQLLTNASMLRHELAAFFGTFGSIRAIYLLYLKIRHAILRVFGRKNEVRNFEFENLWKNSNQGNWGWMPTFLTLSLSLLMLRRLIQYLTSRQTRNQQPDFQTFNRFQDWRSTRHENETQWAHPNPSSPSPYFPQYDSFHGEAFPHGPGNASF